MARTLVGPALVLIIAAACVQGTERAPAPGAGTAAPPVVDANADSFAVVACAPATLRAARDPRSAAVHRVRAGDTLQAWHDTRLAAPGVVLFRKSMSLNAIADEASGATIMLDTPIRFSRTDTLFLLDYLSEGYWNVRFGERRFTVVEFWDGPRDSQLGAGRPITEASIAVATSHPVYDAWYRVRLPDGRHGWWQHDSTEALRSVDHMQKWGERCDTAVPPASPPHASSNEYPYDDVSWADSLVDHGIDFERATRSDSLGPGAVCHTFATYFVLEQELRNEVGAHVIVRPRASRAGCGTDSTAGDFVRRNEWAEYFMALRDDWLFLDSGTGNQRGVFVYHIPSRAKLATFVGEIAGWRDSTTLLAWVAGEDSVPRAACPKVPEGLMAAADSLVAIDLRAGTRALLGRWRCSARE